MLAGRSTQWHDDGSGLPSSPATGDAEPLTAACLDDGMPLFELDGVAPRVHPTAWIAPTASIIGDVTIEENASVWFNVVIRADMGPIVVRAGANVQDGSVLHGGPDTTDIGEGVTIGHGCIVHNATIGTEALIGNGAIVLDRATVGHHTLVAAGSVVTPGTVIGDEVLAVGSPARERGPLNEVQRMWVDGNPEGYRELARRYSKGLREAVS